MPKIKAMVIAGGITLAAVIGGGTYYFLTPNAQVIEESKDPVKDIQTPNIPINEGDYAAEPVKKEAKAADPFRYKEYDESVSWKPGKEAEGKKLIADIHEFYNNLAGWGGAESIDWQSLDRKKMSDDIQAIRDTLEPSKIYNDLDNADSLLGVAFREKDSMSIRFLHRIFHDLDYHLNGTEVDQEWKVTDAFGSPQLVQDHLLGSWAAKN